MSNMDELVDPVYAAKFLDEYYKDIDPQEAKNYLENILKKIDDEGVNKTNILYFLAGFLEKNADAIDIEIIDTLLPKILAYDQCYPMTLKSAMICTIRNFEEIDEKIKQDVIRLAREDKLGEQIGQAVYTNYDFLSDSTANTLLLNLAENVHALPEVGFTLNDQFKKIDPNVRDVIMRKIVDASKGKNISAFDVGAVLIRYFPDHSEKAQNLLFEIANNEKTMRGLVYFLNNHTQWSIDNIKQDFWLRLLNSIKDTLLNNNDMDDKKIELIKVIVRNYKKSGPIGAEIISMLSKNNQMVSNRAKESLMRRFKIIDEDYKSVLTKIEEQM